MQSFHSPLWPEWETPPILDLSLLPPATDRRRYRYAHKAPKSHGETNAQTFLAQAYRRCAAAAGSRSVRAGMDEQCPRGSDVMPTTWQLTSESNISPLSIRILRSFPTLYDECKACGDTSVVSLGAPGSKCI